MKKSKYSVEDLVLDDDFRDIVLNGDEVSLNVWIDQHKLNKELVSEAVEIVHSLRIDEKPVPKEEILASWLQLSNQIEQATAESQPTTSTKKYWVLSGIAASFILLILSYFILFHSDVTITNSQPVTEIISKSNPKGQKSTVFLSDGTKVILNSDSKVSFANSFLTMRREVTLEYGEAYFDVAKDVSKPFIVKTENLEIQVTGTEFNVSAYTDEGTESVSLIEGSVLVKLKDNSETQPLTMKPDDKIVYNKQSKNHMLTEVDVWERGWMNGSLNFQQASLVEIAAKLERWFGASIKVVNGDSRKVKYTGTFDNSSLRNVLEGLSYSLDCTYSMDGKNVIIDLKNN